MHHSPSSLESESRVRTNAKTSTPTIYTMAKNKKRKLHTRTPASSRSQSKPFTTKPNSAAKKQHPSPTIPFDPTSDRILLIGEGDFSFAKSIVEEHGACDVTATCYDGKEELFKKYDPQAEEHVQYLEEGQTVLYNVDATKLDGNKALKKSGGQFDVVMFNFPHVGGKSTDVNRQVRFNQELLVKFFTTCSTLLSQAGTIVVTLFEGEPYTLWNIRDLGRHCGLEVVRSFKFMAEAYPGYGHARTLGNVEGGGGWKGEDREARSYVFQKRVEDKSGVPLRQQQLREQDRKKRKREEDSSSDEDG
ncbi:25S rRNA (uridine-N(3))-methyltransferase [Fulvia fulva]|uniref:25S rRNA (Uridine-N(3))-methyltransferase n=1 Tax=Passalora fulva TaxID=5499 RepID=A0A9Q8UW15_PASFU|nr:25S rRNA (uridine-N(3))-methyltransferase [Fulvia fulva]UJO24432.1 25S rRNA (uridine-N(3))-methyltransferase [Fulvia fulva]WPV37114.1 25S rRNA (uridine-N(3))-methyltransferase [Fulvia fulva]